MDEETQVRQVREFNRAVTRRIGALDDDYRGRGRPLAVSRLLFEIGRAEQGYAVTARRRGLDASGTVTDLGTLDLDAPDRA